MVPLTPRAAGIVLTLSLLLPSSLCADEAVCAKLFARLAGADSRPPVKKKATDFTKEELTDILTKRPCLKHFPWMKGEFLLDQDGLKGVTVARMGEISSSIRKICNEWIKDKTALVRKADDLSPQEQLTLEMLREGIEAENLALFGEFMYLLKLRREAKPEKVVEAIAAIRKHDALKIEAAPMDELEDSTYYTKPSLRCMIALFEYGAKAEVLREEPEKLLPVVTDMLDNWAVLQYHTSLGGDAKVRLLSAVGNLRNKLTETFRLKGEYWEQTAALEKSSVVAGVIAQGDSVVLHLRGRKDHLYALTISRTGLTTHLTPLQAAKAFDAFTLRELRDHSTSDMRLFRVLPEGESYAVTFPDGTTTTVTRAEADRLAKGEKLPSDHPLARALAAAKEASLVMYSHPLMRKAGPELLGATSLTFALQRAYPGMRIHRDPLTAQTAARAKKLNDRELGKLDDLLVLVADDSFRVPQNATVKNIKKELLAAGLQPVVFTGQKYTGPAGRTVIVITGHTSEELAKYVRQLGEAGYLKDNYVVFNSCESPLTEQLLTEMTARFGAAAAFAHEKKIGIDNVQQYVLDFVKKVKATAGQNLLKLLLETLHQNNLNGVWSICRVPRIVLRAA